MADLLVDRGVWISVTVALAITALAAMVAAVARRPVVPAAAVHLPAMAAAVVGAGVALDRYRPGLDTGRGTAPWMWATVGAAAIVVIVALGGGAVGLRRAGRADHHGVLLAAAVALAAIGVFACVPETALLRLAPGPLAVAAVGVAARRVLPSSRVEIVVIVAALGWIAVMDGWTREPAIIGAAGSIAAVALVPLGPNRVDGARPGRAVITMAGPELAVVAVTVAICSRVAGVLEESRRATMTATAITMVALAGGAAAMGWLRRRAGGDPERSEQLEGTQ